MNRMDGVRLCLLTLWLLCLLVSAPLANGDNCAESGRASRNRIRPSSRANNGLSPKRLPDNHKSRALRIQGGRYAEFHELPFLAHFKERTCAASLIDRRHLLTAASCMEDVDRNNFTVYIGCHKGNDGCVAKRVSNFIVHEKFQGVKPYFIDTYNIAIMRTETPIELGLGVHEVNLPNKNDGYDPGEHVTMAGWGDRYHDVEVKPKTNEPKIASDVFVVDSTVCANLVADNGWGLFEADKQICVKDHYSPDNMKSACDTGDIGGPLLGQRWGQYQLVGILLSDVGCGFFPYNPSYYTRVSGFLDWIDWAKREMAPQRQ